MKVLPANNEVLLREFQNKNIETCYIYELLEDKQVTCVHFGVTKDFNRELYVINID